MDVSYDVIFIGLSRWDSILNSSVVNIASEWSKTSRVFYIDRPFSIKDYFIKREKEAISKNKALFFGKNKYSKVVLNSNEVIVVTPLLSLPINALPEGQFYELLHSYNRRIITQTIAAIIKDFGIKNYIYFNNFIPEYFDVFPPRIKQPLLKIYRSSDDISQEPYIAKHGVNKEHWAINNADLVLVSSQGLQQKLSLIKEPVHLVSNAIKLELFNSFKTDYKLEQLNGNKRKTVVFTGNVSALRFDYNLLLLLVKELPDCHFLMIGPYKENELKAAQLLNCDNIQWLGPMRIEQMANYIYQADCTIIPYLCNTLTFSIYPLKINEYLAMGKPVVSTCFSEDIAAFSDFIYLAKTHQEFLEQLKKALAEPNDEVFKIRRKQVAQKNNWTSRVDEIKALVEAKMSSKKN